MKTESTECPIEPLTKLVSMSDFVFHLRNKTKSELYKAYPKIFRNPNDFIAKDNIVEAMVLTDAIQWRLTGEYAKFLKQPLKLEMFVPVNGEEKVLFKGFYLKEEIRKGIVLDKVETYMYKGNTTMPFAEIHDGKRLRFIVPRIYSETIEDIAGYGLELTDTALKQIFDHASH